MVKKSKIPQPQTTEFYSICLSKNPKPASHLKLCARCAQKVDEEKLFWKWRIKKPEERPCSGEICRKCGWSFAEHKMKLVKK